MIKFMNFGKNNANSNIQKGDVFIQNQMQNKESYPLKQYNEKSESFDTMIKTITIDSNFVDVLFFDSSEDSVSFCLKGTACSSEDIIMNTSFGKDIAAVEICFSGICEKCNLILEIHVPEKIEREFQVVKIKTMSGNVTIPSNIQIDELIFDSMSGDLLLKEIAQVIVCKTMSGDVVIDGYAEQNTNINVITMSGDIHIKLENVKELFFNYNTMSGDVKNKYNKLITKQKYNAVVSCSTMSGDISIL